MTNYYYSSNPDVEHKEKKWNFELLGNNIHFTTDNGVFSKNTVDFGTRVLLETIDANLDLDNKKILDMGCGYGPIGLSIAKAYPNSQVDMVDVNELALELAKKNAANNNINNVKIFKSSQYEDINETDNYKSTYKSGKGCCSWDFSRIKATFKSRWQYCSCNSKETRCTFCNKEIK